MTNVIDICLWGLKPGYRISMSDENSIMQHSIAIRFSDRQGMLGAYGNERVWMNYDSGVKAGWRCSAVE
jgi:hypothetical protein